MGNSTDRLVRGFRPVVIMRPDCEQRRAPKFAMKKRPPLYSAALSSFSDGRKRKDSLLIR